LTGGEKKSHHVATRWIASVALVGLVGLVALAGCGGSSKPAYCSARADLQNSIQGVTNLSPSSGVSALQAQFQKVKAAADKVVTQAKSDFPNETSAVKSSVDALTSSVNALTANPSAGQIAAVTNAASTALSSVQSFLDASKSKCS
jgi:cell division protein FtsB